MSPIDGAVPSLPYVDQLLVDGRVCDRAFAVIQGAETEDSVRVKTSDLVKLTRALLVDLCHDVGPAAAFRH